MRRSLPILILLAVPLSGYGQNPIIPDKGVNDPHIRIIDGKAYLSATHDKSVENDRFIMDDWWLWSSDDLVDWKLEAVLNPEDTYLGKPFSSCWATDFVKRNGKYYWYFSEGNQQAGVVVADSPSGPWRDPLGKPLLATNLTPTHEYDMSIVEDKSGDFYIVFGVWDFYIAKLNNDMISLAEKPRRIEISNPHGPYNQDGKRGEMQTDDKPFLHLYNGNYYLSWGCFYAMSENIYGPYSYRGSVIEKESFTEGYDAPTWPNGFKQGRHGSFFEWHNQWYFSYCDISQTGNRFFRDTFISYVHYKSNGEMALIRVDGVGVGRYDVRTGRVEAEDYFKASGTSKTELSNGSFAVSSIDDGDYLVYPNINGLENKTKINFEASKVKEVTIELRKDSPEGVLLASYQFKDRSGREDSNVFDFPRQESKASLCFVFRGGEDDLLIVDSFSFN
jgi:hypothetical protein